MSALQSPLPRLPRLSWRWTRAFVIAVLVSSALTGAFAALLNQPAQAVLYGALYPLVIVAIVAVPAFLLIWLAPPVNKSLVVPTALICCALPPLIATALSDFPQWTYAFPRIGAYGLAGGVGGLAFCAFRDVHRPAPIARTLLAGIAVIFLLSSVWLVAWRVPDPHGRADTGSWEAANPRECQLMARAIREIRFDQLAGHPPLMSQAKAGGPCDWGAFGMPLRRVTSNEFREAAGPDLNGRYIEHIGVSRPRYSLLHLRALVEVSHHYGPLGGDGFYCSFRRGLSGWVFISCRRAWIA